MTHGQSFCQNWAPNEWYLKCGYNEYWHGYNQYNYGHIQTSLNGCGIGNVTFRNCGYQGSNHKVYTRAHKFAHISFYFDSSSATRYHIKKCHSYDPP